jgi:hypothetical protein
MGWSWLTWFSGKISMVKKNDGQSPLREGNPSPVPGNGVKLRVQRRDRVSDSHAVQVKFQNKAAIEVKLIVSSEFDVRPPVHWGIND